MDALTETNQLAIEGWKPASLSFLLHPIARGEDSPDPGVMCFGGRLCACRAIASLFGKGCFAPPRHHGHWQWPQAGPLLISQVFKPRGRDPIWLRMKSLTPDFMGVLTGSTGMPSTGRAALTKGTS